MIVLTEPSRVRPVARRKHRVGLRGQPLPPVRDYRVAVYRISDSPPDPRVRKHRVGQVHAHVCHDDSGSRALFQLRVLQELVDEHGRHRVLNEIDVAFYQLEDAHVVVLHHAKREPLGFGLFAVVIRVRLELDRGIGREAHEPIRAGAYRRTPEELSSLHRHLFRDDSTGQPRHERSVRLLHVDAHYEGRLRLNAVYPFVRAFVRRRDLSAHNRPECVYHVVRRQRGSVVKENAGTESKPVRRVREPVYLLGEAGNDIQVFVKADKAFADQRAYLVPLGIGREPWIESERSSWDGNDESGAGGCRFGARGEKTQNQQCEVRRS